MVAVEFSTKELISPTKIDSEDIILNRCTTTEIDVESFYETVSTKGSHTYGPSFQLVTELHTTPNMVMKRWG